MSGRKASQAEGIASVQAPRYGCDLTCPRTHEEASALEQSGRGRAVDESREAKGPREKHWSAF